ncbi:MAG: histone deacetylase family protein [Nocardioides sp.]
MNMAPPRNSWSAIPVVWSAETRLHDPGFEVWVGVPTAGTETADRVDAILGSLSRHSLVATVGHDDTVLTSVHERAFLDFLASAHQRWMAGPYVELVGQDRVVPYLFSTPALVQGMSPRQPTATHALVGEYCYDTMTLVGPGTWRAARAAVDCALTAADLVVAGAPAAYALCRPPGHHATRSGYGGSCYLNNAAVAATALRAAGHHRVAVLDLDAHHGNGTQAIFWNDPSVLYGSVHVDPGAGWFPHVFGHADEVGAPAAAGANLNLPMPEGADDQPWLVAVERLADWVSAAGCTAVVVSLGVDAAAEDPESPLMVTHDGYRSAGNLLGGLGMSSVIVQEGGYHLPSLGDLVASYLAGHDEAR